MPAFLVAAAILVSATVWDAEAIEVDPAAQAIATAIPEHAASIGTR